MVQSKPWIGPVGIASALLRGRKQVIAAIRSIPHIPLPPELCCIVADYARTNDRVLILDAKSAVYWQPFTSDADEYKELTGGEEVESAKYIRRASSEAISGIPL